MAVADGNRREPGDEKKSVHMGCLGERWVAAQVHTCNFDIQCDEAGALRVLDWVIEGWCSVLFCLFVF